MCLGVFGVVLTLFSANQTATRPHLSVAETTTTAEVFNIVVSGTTKAGPFPRTTDSAMPTLLSRSLLKP
jgi:hypothetical protein